MIVMANLLDSLATNKKSEVAITTTSATEVKAEKSQLSLFDSLLKDTLTSSEVSKETEIIKNPSNPTSEKNLKDTTTQISNTEENIINKVGKNTESLTSPQNQVNPTNSNNSTSLLDRLVLEAKTTKESTPQVEELKIQNNKSIVDNKEVSKTLQKSANLKENIEKADINKTVDQKVETNSVVSNAKVAEDNGEVIVKVENKEISKNDNSKIVDKNSNEVKTTKVEVPKQIELEIENKTVDQKVETNSVVSNAKVAEDNGEVIVKVENKEISKNDNSKIVEINSEISNDTKVTDINSSHSDVNKQKAAEELANINSETPKTVNIEKNVLTSDKVEEKENINQKKSLMDQLIEKNKAVEENVVSKETQKITTLNDFENRIIKNENSSKDILTNIYLSSQKNSISNQALFNKNEAVNLAKDGKTVTDIQNSANMLDLGLEDLDIDKELVLDKKVDLQQVDRKNLLDRLAFDKNIKHDDIKNLITKSVEASKALIEDTITKIDDITLTVNSPLSQNIQTRIIGARQQMSNMMSDIAKQMYENYKPPVTVFRINLNPLHLGSIAIMMKNDKDNSLSISMSVSNNSTLDAMVDNQNVLRNSLNKTFEDTTKFNLDFNSNEQNNNQSSNNNQSGNRKFEDNIATQSILESREDNLEVEDRNTDYM